MPNPDGSPTPAEIDDFVARNGGETGGGGGRGDRGRAVEALTNYTGDREFDSQGPMYDQRTNQLSAEGQAASAARRQPGAAMSSPMGLSQLASLGRASMGTNPMASLPVPAPSTPSTWMQDVYALA